MMTVMMMTGIKRAVRILSLLGESKWERCAAGAKQVWIKHITPNRQMMEASIDIFILHCQLSAMSAKKDKQPVGVQ